MSIQLKKVSMLTVRVRRCRWRSKRVSARLRLGSTTPTGSHQDRHLPHPQPQYCHLFSLLSLRASLLDRVTASSATARRTRSTLRTGVSQTARAEVARSDESQASSAAHRTARVDRTTQVHHRRLIVRQRSRAVVVERAVSCTRTRMVRSRVGRATSSPQTRASLVDRTHLTHRQEHRHPCHHSHQRGARLPRRCQLKRATRRGTAARHQGILAHPRANRRGTTRSARARTRSPSRRAGRLS